MEVLKEFLETSTIHGLAYISTAQNKTAKALWFIIICFGFLGAFLLISKSYSDWQTSPISTSISTHPLDDLDFPTVAVCPPEGSNTALNYDLIRAANHSFSKEEQERVEEAVWKHFVEEEHRSFAEEMIAAANPTQMKAMYEGYQSVPRPYNHGYEVVVWNTSGTIRSSWYGEEYKEERFKKNRDVHVVLDFPPNIGDLVGSGSLVIELEVDIREEEGWVEEVQYSEGARFKHIFNENSGSFGSTWNQAELDCQSKGGHLASVLSKWEKHELGELEKESGLAELDYAWIGGKMEHDGIGQGWRTEWSDGAKNTIRTSNLEYLTDDDNQKCILQDLFGDMEKRNCEELFSWVCRIKGHKVKASTIRLEYTKEQLSFSSFQVWYSLKAANKNLLDSWKEKRMTGFMLSWHIQNEHPPIYMELTTKGLGSSLVTPGFGDDLEEDFYNANKKFNATVIITDDLLEQIGKGKLVVEIQMRTMKEENAAEDFYLIEPRYIWGEDATWDNAENYCNDLGGHLASAETYEETRNILELAQGFGVWLGGRKVRDTWRWSNGEKMTNKTWSPNAREELLDQCSCMQNGFWYKLNCGIIYPSICSFPTASKINRNTTLSTLIRSYSRGQIASVPSIKMEYQYRENNKQNLKREEAQRRPGFKMEWYIRSENGTRVTIKEDEGETQIWSDVKSAPRRLDENLLKTIRIAATKRMLNMSKDDIIKEGIKKKTDLLKSWRHAYRICVGEQYRYFFDQLSQEQITDQTTSTTQEDIEVGLALYTIWLHCPKEILKLAAFVLDLATTESLPTIILAIVNTLQSDQLTLYHKILLGSIYKALDDTFGLSLGKILLATSSPALLSAFQNQELPYFNLSDHNVLRCLSGPSCAELFGHLQAPGVAKASLHPPHLTGSKGLPALIPFCAYGGNMAILGENINDLDFPVCNAFKPTILDGELCYSLNMKDFISAESRPVSKAGRGEGLLLAIDNGISIRPFDEKSIEVKKNFIRTKSRSSGGKASFHILTLHRHEDSKPGVYTLTNLKQMAGTENFLGLSDDKKKCQIEGTEKCRSRHFVQEVQRKCECVPWSLSTLFPDQVHKICTPNATICANDLKKDEFGCNVSCTGLYAGVTFYDISPEDTKKYMIQDSKVFSQLKRDYKTYKNTFSRNVKFNSTSPNLASTNEAEIYFIEIFFDISTYDKVEQDKKMTLEAQLGLIGGTMGLLTGFSILSGVEIIYYAIKFFASLRVKQ